jgi:hypothetical protein
VVEYLPGECVLLLDAFLDEVGEGGLVGDLIGDVFEHLLPRVSGCPSRNPLEAGWSGGALLGLSNSLGAFAGDSKLKMKLSPLTVSEAGLR